MRYDNLSAVVMHVRPYRETSVMVQFFTREQGRLVGVMKGVRRGKNPVSVQPFNIGHLGCSGRQGLMTVTRFDVDNRLALAGVTLSAGFYVLELISRCLAEQQVEPKIYTAAIDTLYSLSNMNKTTSSNLAILLRQFEAQLLNELGYGLDYGYDAVSGDAVEAEQDYIWQADRGFSVDMLDDKPVENSQSAIRAIPGWILLAMSRGDYSDARVLRMAKRLHQFALSPLLGSSPLISRSMYPRDLHVGEQQSG